MDEIEGNYKLEPLKYRKYLKGIVSHVNRQGEVMTLYGNLADSVKWKLCEFVSARPVGGDSNIEYDFALEIIQMVREQIAKEQKEYLDHWRYFYLDTYPDDVIDCVGRDLIAIAKGSDVNGG